MDRRDLGEKENLKMEGSFVGGILVCAPAESYRLPLWGSGAS